MKKKLIACILCAAMAGSFTCAVSAYDAKVVTEAELPAAPEFEANEASTYWTTVEYTIEDLGEDMVCTVCADGEFKQFEIKCNFFGDDQDWIGEYDAEAKTVKTTSDKTGFMEGDAPKIIEKALEQNLWIGAGDAAAAPAADAAAPAAGVTEADLPAAPEFEAKADYYQWTTVEYTIEDLGEDMVCTVSADEELKKFDILCNFFGDDQDWEGEYDAAAKTVKTTADKTGFMEGDAPKIIEKAIEQNLWVIPSAAAAADAAAPAADGAAADASALPAAPEFEPNKDYAQYTTVEYTIEDLGEDMICTVSADADLKKFDILCNFFGDDQDWAGEYDAAAKTVTTTSDKTGFMEGDAPKIIEKAIEQNIWVPIA